MQNISKIYSPIIYLILIFFSFGVNFYYANLGIEPADSFVLYNGGFKVFKNLVPFQDYWLVTGPLMDYLNAFFFNILGVSWKSYIINGSVINSLISIIFFYTVRSFNQSRSYSLFYALCFSVLANPSMGTPFPDHYSTFLSLIGVFFFFLALKKEKKIHLAIFTQIFL